ncbi:diamine acetyltransferase 2b isoform X2 [Paramisgurnus dabryanus]|uniref:diamine acetyltransferase 2b isoform X2 n=1 Tax=Paramisgurnus dabryanus TaxID=90735 RepID=UPI0031F344E7
MKFIVRAGNADDCRDIERMIRELAVYEKMPDQVKISHRELERDGFGSNPYYQCLIAEVPEEQKSKDGHTKVGYALFFYTYSTWKGRVVFIEDLYVMPDYRGAQQEHRHHHSLPARVSPGSSPATGRSSTSSSTGRSSVLVFYLLFLHLPQLLFPVLWLIKIATNIRLG